MVARSLFGEYPFLGSLYENNHPQFSPSALRHFFQRSQPCNWGSCRNMSTAAVPCSKSASGRIQKTNSPQACLCRNQNWRNPCRSRTVYTLRTREMLQTNKQTKKQRRKLGTNNWTSKPKTIKQTNKQNQFSRIVTSSLFRVSLHHIYQALLLRDIWSGEWLVQGILQAEQKWSLFTRYPLVSFARRGPFPRDSNRNSS